MMNLADIIKIKMDLENAGYPAQTIICKSKYRCFGDPTVNCSSDTTVTFGLQVSGRFALWAEIDLFQQTLYLVDYYSYPGDEVLRWVHPRYKSAFANELFERQEDPTITTDGMQIHTHINDDVVLDTIHGEILGLKIDSTDDEQYETVALELTDSELATIARAAHVKDMTINDFINEALKIKLDHVMPDWREEYKNGGL